MRATEGEEEEEEEKESFIHSFNVI